MLLLSVKGFFDNIFLFIDGVVYNFVRYACQIFDFLAKLNLFDESDYQAIVERIYIILGVVMLFILAYSLLKAVINPDDFSKGDLSVPNLIKNVVISLVIIAVLPTVFTLAFNIQNSLFNNNVIGKLILVPNSTIDTSKDISYDEGGTLSYYAFQAFFHPSIEYCQKENLEFDECTKSIKARGGFFNTQNYGNLADVNNMVLHEKLSFTYYANFGDEVAKGEIDYSIFISTIVGLLLALVLLSYCVDLGIRVVKLVFYQIIAPIPVICRVLPNQKKIFDTWVKKTISTFLEAFIRIAIMYLGIYLINLIVVKIGDIISASSITSVTSNGLGITQLLMVRVFLIVGVVLFIRQAPGLIKDLFGFDLGGANPFQRILGMGAAAGAGTLGAIRNFNKGINGDKGFWKSLGSGVAGGASAATRAAYNARNAKGLMDMKNAASKGLVGAADARTKRAKYKADHGGKLFGHDEKGNTIGVIPGRFRDFNDWLTGAGVEELDSLISVASEIGKGNDDFRSLIEKQFNKKITDAGLVAKMGEDDFKGSTPQEIKRLHELYEGYSGKSFATIKQDIERRREMAQKGTYNLSVEQNKKLRDQVEKELAQMIAKDNSIFKTEDEYNAAYSSRLAELTGVVASEEVALLDSMYNQAWKFSVTAAGDAALSGKSYSTISAGDLFDAREVGEENLQRIQSAGIPIIDPSKEKDKQAIKMDDGKAGKYLDDVATGVKKQASQASRQKQRYFEKKSK